MAFSTNTLPRDLSSTRFCAHNYIVYMGSPARKSSNRRFSFLWRREHTGKALRPLPMSDAL